MINTVKMLLILVVFALLMPFGSTLSYAWDHEHEGHSGGHGYHGYGGRGYGHFGVVFNYSPYYNPYYPYYYDPGILVSSPVVETPEIVDQPSTAVMTTAQITATDTDNEININIPNTKGGYTSVLLKRSGKGFIGPQGEYYSEFPRVSQLKIMYG